MSSRGFPVGLAGKESTCNARDTGHLGLIRGLGRFFGGGHSNPLQYSCQEDPMDRRAMAHGVAKSDMSEATEHTHTHTRCRLHSSDFILMWPNLIGDRVKPNLSSLVPCPPIPHGNHSLSCLRLTSGVNSLAAQTPVLAYFAS